MHRTAIPIVAFAAVAAAVLPASAAPKTISGTYTATAPAPDPTPFTGQTGGNCRPTLDQAKHEQEVALPAAGLWNVELGGYTGDWALAILDPKGTVLADSDNDISTVAEMAPEKIKYKIKKAGTYAIRGCNFAGGPTATVKWTFTYGS